jgi:hypothetical protein
MMFRLHGILLNDPKAFSLFGQQRVSRQARNMFSRLLIPDCDRNHPSMLGKSMCLHAAFVAKTKENKAQKLHVEGGRRTDCANGPQTREMINFYQGTDKLCRQSATNLSLVHI